MPNSPRLETTSRPISFEMYSWVRDMEADRKRVSFVAMLGGCGRRKAAQAGQCIDSTVFETRDSQSDDEEKEGRLDSSLIDAYS